jgi:hypothetical protein
MPKVILTRSLSVNTDRLDAVEEAEAVEDGDERADMEELAEVVLEADEEAVWLVARVDVALGVALDVRERVAVTEGEAQS